MAETSGEREEVLLTARLTLPDAARRLYLVRNISAGGACLNHRGELAQGVRIKASIGRLDEVDAEIVWVGPERAGLRFTDPIDVALAKAAA